MPKVSVCIITYNHEQFIKDAIEGILKQNCSFDRELVIGEDCSTDATRSICQEFAKSNPEIRLLPASQNLGVAQNLIRTIRECKGEYIAFCEGDDYWIDPNKLNKQIEIIESDKKISLVHTNGFQLINGELTEWHNWPVLEGYVSKTFYFGNITRTCSILFLREYAIEFINSFEEYFKIDLPLAVDWALCAFVSKKGSFAYLPEKMVVYRFNPNSVTSPQNIESLIKYNEAIINIKRYLRDEIFPDEINELYDENVLSNEKYYIYLKVAFINWDYQSAWQISTKVNSPNKKIKKLMRFTSNPALFYVGCLIRTFIHLNSVIRHLYSFNYLPKSW